MTRTKTLLQATLTLAALLVLAGTRADAESWELLGLQGISLETVTVDPVDDQILYAGGGPEFGSGMWKSIDGGATWTPINNGLGIIHRVNTIAIEPSSGLENPRTLLIGVLKSGGPNLFRSTDGGETWQPATTGLPNTTDEVAILLFDPTNPAIVYAGLNGPIGGAAKSTDGGLTWSDISLGVPDAFCARSCVLDLALHPSAPSTLYATMPALREIYKTTDGGATWSATGVGLLPERVEVAPTAPATIYTTGTVPSQGGVARSLDGGGSWQNLKDQPGLPPSRDASYRALAVDPTDANTLWMLVEDLNPFPTLEAVFTSQDGGLNWAIADDGLEGVRVYDLVYHGRSVLAATDHGLYRRTVGPPAAGCVPDPTTLCLGGSRFRVAVDFRDPGGNQGQGRVVPVSSQDSGLFWFFSPDNWELLIKVLDGCTINNHYWVFSAATTNVEYTLRVTDTQANEKATYVNPLGQAAAAITDTTAFATCP